MVPAVTRARGASGTSPIQKLAGVALKGVALKLPVQFQPGLVDGFPTFGRQAPRTARAFSRAARRHDTMDEGLYPSRTMKSSTLAGVISPYLAVKAGISSLMESPPSLRAQLLRLGQQRGFVAHAQHAGGVLCPPVARHPEQMVGGAAQHF